MPKGWPNASIKNRKMLAAFGIKNIFWMENKIKRFFAINQGGKKKGGGSLNNNPRDTSDEDLIELLYKMTGLY